MLRCACFQLGHITTSLLARVGPLFAGHVEVRVESKYVQGEVNMQSLWKNTKMLRITFGMCPKNKRTQKSLSPRTKIARRLFQIVRGANTYNRVI